MYLTDCLHYNYVHSAVDFHVSPGGERVAETKVGECSEDVGNRRDPFTDPEGERTPGQSDQSEKHARIRRQ